MIADTADKDIFEASGPAHLLRAVSENPILVPFQHALGDRFFECPDFNALLPKHVLPAVNFLLTDFSRAIDSVCHTDVIRFESIITPLEVANARLKQGFGAVEHLYRVQDSPELREIYELAQTRVTQFLSELNQNYALYLQLKALDMQQSETGVQARVLARWLLEFERGGVHLKGPQAAAFLDNVQQLAALATQFEQQLLDATQAFAMDIDEADAEVKLAGLPDYALAMLRAQAVEAGVFGYRISLRYACYAAVMNFAKNRELRAQVFRAYATRASENCVSGFDNGPVIEAITRLRLRNAELLGFHCPAELVLLDKMAGSVADVEQFLLKLTAQVRPHAAIELQTLHEFAKTQGLLGANQTLEAWDLNFISERYKQQQLGFDSPSLKNYFEIEHVLCALSELSDALFGLHFERDFGMPCWHQDVRFYRLVDAQGISAAGFYLDMYARSGKRSGAWMDVCSARIVGSDRVQLPIAHLVCNFAPAAGDSHAALSHDELLTLLHEFGHGLHLMLTQVQTPGASGIDGIEWDAIELPSQLMENFGWHSTGLALFGKHAETGEAIPDALVNALMQSRSQLAGLRLIRQLEFASFDFAIHCQQQRLTIKKIMQQLNYVRAKISVLEAPAWQRFPHGFSHIFAGGYAAVYYGYLWAEVLSADAFSWLAEQTCAHSNEPSAQLLRAFGERFRSHILAIGSSVPALDAFTAMRGRAPDSTNLLESYGLQINPNTTFTNPAKH